MWVFFGLVILAFVIGLCAGAIEGGAYNIAAKIEEISKTSHNICVMQCQIHSNYGNPCPVFSNYTCGVSACKLALHNT